MKWLLAMMSMFLFFLVTPIDVAATIDINENPVCIAVDNDVGTFGYLYNNTAIQQESPLFSLNQNYYSYEVNRAEFGKANRQNENNPVNGVVVLNVGLINDFGITITESKTGKYNQYKSPYYRSEYYNLDYIRVL